MKHPDSYCEKTSSILDLCSGKKVLHLGCVGFTDCPPQVKMKLAGQTLHARLSECCDCIGVDLDGETISSLRDVFDNVREGDVEHLQDLDLPEREFDFVVAGDIIEHLSNPGLMLDGIRPLLKAGGKLVVSTPNAFGLLPFFRHAFGRFAEGAQHVLAFNSETLRQLLERHDFEVERLVTCHQPHAAESHPLGFVLGRRLFRVFPHLGGTLLIVAKTS